MKSLFLISLSLISLASYAQVDQQNGSAFTQADLTKRVGSSNGYQIKVGGANSIGDGGGGTWRWDATYSGAAAAGSVIKVTGVTTGAWRLVPQDLTTIHGLQPYVLNAVAPKLDKFTNGDSNHYVGTDNQGHVLPSYGRANIVKLDTLQSSTVLDSNYNAEVMFVDTDLPIVFSAGTSVGGTDIVDNETIRPTSQAIIIYRKFPAGTIIYFTYIYSGTMPKANAWLPQ